MLKLDREKYLQILRNQGVNAALTELHRDTEKMEWDTFEGENGYQPKSWEALKEVRAFSRELWEVALKQSNQGQNPQR